MVKEKRFLVDVGMADLPFPMRVLSKAYPNGQPTIANIAINARIMHDFEARWIDEFIKIVHSHRDRIGTKTLKVNIKDYVKKLKASVVKINFNYPFFIEKLTPASKEKCLVRYLCSYAAKATSVKGKVDISFKIEIPYISTYPMSKSQKSKGLFGQLSIMDIEISPTKDVYPEDIVKIVDKHALAPVYSFLTEEDQDFIIDIIHKKEKSSVVILNAIKNDLARNKKIDWYTVRSRNFGMLHSYSTVIETEKSQWVPFSGYTDEEI